MKPPLDASRAGSEAEETERQLAKLTKINAALMQRVEKSMDQQANAFSLFQTAITLEGQVRVRTDELKTALSRLERTNDELTTARDTSERANRFKTRFFTAVGHDLLQPLHAARLSVSALTDPSVDARSAPPRRPRRARADDHRGSAEVDPRHLQARGWRHRSHPARRCRSTSYSPRSRWTSNPWRAPRTSRSPGAAQTSRSSPIR